MKNLFSASTLAGVFLVFAVTGIHADHRIKNKKTDVSSDQTAADPRGGTREASAPSVSEKSAASSEGCCPGRCCPPEQAGSTDASASPDEGVVSPRDPASGLPTGKRQHKPLTITKELDKSTPLSKDAEAPATAADGKASTSGGCCPGRCCPPEQTGTAAAAPIRESPTEPSRGGDAGAAMIQCPPGMIQTTLPDGKVGCKEGKGTQSARLLPTVNKKTAASSEGCCPGRCCPPEQTSTNAAGTSSAEIECPPGTVPSGSAGCVPQAQGMAINEKGLPGGKSTTKDTKKKDSK